MDKHCILTPFGAKNPLLFASTLLSGDTGCLNMSLIRLFVFLAMKPFILLRVVLGLLVKSTGTMAISEP